LTLNLGSYHPVIARPASRLSQISSFFGQSQQSQSHSHNRRSPQSNRMSLINETQSRVDIDFSQPLAEKWSLSTATNQQGRGRPASHKSNRSRIGSRRSNSDSEKVTERRSSAWPFGAIAAALSGSKPRVEPGSRNGSIEGRRGMEWIRTIVSSDSGFGFNHDTSRDPSSSRGLPPPPRRGVSPMTSTNLLSTTRGLYPQSNSQDSHSPNPMSPDIVSPNPPPSYVTQSDEDSLSPRTEGCSSRQLAPSHSLRRKRVDKGLPVPELALARDAISPALWVDEDTLDRLEDRNPSPPVPAMLSSSVAPLAISKRNPNHNPPPLPGKSGPTAFTFNPNLISKFSPGSSRASFATTHDGRSSIPAPHVPDRNSRNENEEDVPPIRRETDGDSIATRRYDRSAVTPQLPTLTTSNADAFRQEMADISASTGEDREERVISFHGGR